VARTGDGVTAGFRDLFLAGLVQRYPDLEGPQEPLDDVHLRR
jgi:hypothetical protein